MTTQRLHRRSIVTGLALGAPLAALATGQAAAQTPEASPVSGDDPFGLAAQVLAMEPADLLAALQETEVGHTQFELFTDLAIAGWPEEDLPSLDGSVVGGVYLYVAAASIEDRDSVLGGILVLDTPESATVALDQMLADLDPTTTTAPLAIGGFQGYSAVSEGDSGSAILQVGNVLALSTDALITDGARTRPISALARSTVHLMATLNHLDKATRPE